MTVVNRLPFPASQLIKSDGTPAVSWTYTFYLSGTPTLANVYTAVDLTGPTNALVLNAYGMPDVDIFLDPDVNYKLVIADDAGTPIFTYNNVRDFARRAIAHFTIYAGNPNGNVAGTAGVVGGTPADAIFDTTNGIIWICTTTGTAGTAVWTNVSSALTGAVSFTGVLTPAPFSTQQDNYNPTDLTTSSSIRFNPGADSDMTGIAGGASGRQMTLVNTNPTFIVTLRNENASSTAANRFLLPNGLDVRLLPNYVCVLQYDSLTGRWRLKSPPLMLPLGSIHYISNATIVTSVGSSQLTIALKTLLGNDPSPGDPVIICFRNSTIGTGNYVYRTLTTALSLVISSTSLLGTVNSTPFKLWAVVFDDAGTLRLGVINTVAGGATPTGIYPLGQVPIASSTAEGGAGAADAAQTFYTGSAVTSKAYVPLGYLSYEAGLATAGTWSAVPTRIQLYGPGVPLPGNKIQDLRTSVTVVLNPAGVVIPNDDTIPQIGEGAAYANLSQAITPTSATNILIIRHEGQWASAGTTYPIFTIIKSGLADAVAAAQHFDQTSMIRISMEHRRLAADTTEQTYSVRAGDSAGNIQTLNGVGGTRHLGGALESFVSAAEIMT